jgi:anti-sigma28 factor (negative regulator of flagellin synthesis)
MKITGKSFEVLRPAGAKPAGAVQGSSTDASTVQPSGTTGTTGRADSVQISDAGRTLSGSSASSPMSAERVAELRKRVLEGAYNSTQVVDKVAKRILERGDV